MELEGFRSDEPQRGGWLRVCSDWGTKKILDEAEILRKIKLTEGVGSAGASMSLKINKDYNSMEVGAHATYPCAPEDVQDVQRYALKKCDELIAECVDSVNLRLNGL